MVIIAIYVDDLLIFSNDEVEKQKLKSGLMKHLKMKDLGEAHYCLGMKISRDRDQGCITVDQKQHIENLLKRFHMEDCIGVQTPLDVGQNLFDVELQRKNDGIKFDVPYQEAVGSLMYLAQGTRPDIAFRVGLLSRFNNNHGPAHFAAVKRIMRYIRHKADYKLKYQRGDADLVGYCDSDWAGDKQDFKSTAGYVFVMSDAARSWSSKKEPTVAKSSMEAEYMALSFAASEGIWLKGLCAEFNPTGTQCMTIYCDNKGAVDLSKNMNHHPRTKPISIQHHFIRDRVTKGDISVFKIASKEMVADCITKGLGRKDNNRCANAFTTCNKC